MHPDLQTIIFRYRAAQQGLAQRQQNSTKSEVSAGG